MGKQVNRELRRIAKQLYEKSPELFSNSFENNKKKLTEIGIQIPKKERNIVAGILVKLAEKKEL